MNIFSTSSDDYIDKANDAAQSAYTSANNYQAPYSQYGAQDFDSARSFLLGSLGNRQDYDSNFYKYLNMSPEDIFNDIFSGYSESPFAKDQMAFGIDAANNAETAAGMGGSGNNEAADAEIGKVIGDSDMSNYFDNIMGIAKDQRGLLDKYDNQTSGLEKMFSQLLGTEKDSADTMSSNAMRFGQQESQNYDRGASDNRNRIGPITQAASIAGALARILKY